MADTLDEKLDELNGDIDRLEEKYRPWVQANQKNFYIMLLTVTLSQSVAGLGAEFVRTFIIHMINGLAKRGGSDVH
ncbi:MAG: hypothetical protein CTY18_06115 [Methylomonas sp.]|nr:MAG: hypothetical protein CTY18_06115 [Methylomonas sp.]